MLLIYNVIPNRYRNKVFQWQIPYYKLTKFFATGFWETNRGANNSRYMDGAAILESCQLKVTSAGFGR